MGACSTKNIEEPHDSHSVHYPHETATSEPRPSHHSHHRRSMVDGDVNGRFLKLTPDDKQILRSTWQIFSTGHISHDTVEISLRLFVIKPELARLFHVDGTSTFESLKSNAKLCEHMKQMMSVLDTAVSYLDRSEEDINQFAESCVELGRNHCQHRVQTEDLEHMAVSILHGMEWKLMGHFTHHAKNCWCILLGFVAANMRRGIQDDLIGPLPSEDPRQSNLSLEVPREH